MAVVPRGGPHNPLSRHCIVVTNKPGRSTHASFKEINSTFKYKKLHSPTPSAFQEAFFTDLYLSDIHLTSDIHDVDLALDYFTNNFLAIVDKHAPFKKLKIKDRTNPWFSSELSNLFKSRNTAWSCARRSGSPSDLLVFRQLRNKCTSQVRKAKSIYYLDLIQRSHTNPAKFWRAVNSLNKNKCINNNLPTQIVFNGCVISDKKEICQAFNKHFCAVGHLFNNACVTSPSVSNSTSCLPNHSSQFTLQPISPYLVANALNTIDPRKSTGADKLDPLFLKLSTPFIIEPISHIFNLSISSGTIPNIWKSAFVTPLYKGVKNSDPNNYRPISKLPCLAKILESMVNAQLKTFLSTNSVLNLHQSGFRPMHSTISAITLVVNDIISNIDKKKHCAAVFVDLSKAFDTVNQIIILMQTLKNTGFDHGACSWFHSYLSGRQQCVKAGNIKSELAHLTKGVPQGSVLGPVLFTIYINNIVSSITNCHIHLYADDTVLYCFADSVQVAVDHLQLCFNSRQTELTNL